MKRPRIPAAATRGIIWILLGVVVHVGALAFGTPLVIRGTRVPWGAVVVGVGVLLLAYDLWRDRRKGRNAGGRSGPG